MNDFLKTAADLTAHARKKIKKSNFAIPGKTEGKAGKGSYPIHDLPHARNALARVSQHGSPEEIAQVRSKVYSKYPALADRKVEKTAQELTMTPTKMYAFANELTKTAKPKNLGTLLGQKVVATKAMAKTKQPKMAKKAGLGKALLERADVGLNAKARGEQLAHAISRGAGKASAGFGAVGKAVRANPKKAIAAGAVGAGMALHHHNKKK